MEAKHLQNIYSGDGLAIFSSSSASRIAIEWVSPSNYYKSFVGAPDPNSYKCEPRPCCFYLSKLNP